MRAAPSFVVQTHSSRGWQIFVWALCGTCVGSLLLWLLHVHLLGLTRPLAWWTTLPAGALLVSALHAGARQALSLGWDGAQWRWHLPPGSEPVEGAVRVRVDLGRWLLLQLTEVQPGAPRWPGTCWVALSEADVGAACWHGLRCALYSSRRMNADAALPHPAAPPVTPGLPHSG